MAWCICSRRQKSISRLGWWARAGRCAEFTICPALVASVREFGQDADWFLPTAESLSLSYLAERYPGDFDPMPPKDEIAEFLSHVERLATELQIQHT